MENRDENLDVLLLICQLLPQKQRLRVSRVSKGWHQAAISATRSLKATVNQAKAPSLTQWLRRNGAALERLCIHSREPSNIPYGYLMTKAPVAPVSLSLPCTALPKLCLLHLNDINIVMENLASSSLPASLTSMKTVDSPSITSYISALTGLRQLNMSCISFPTGVLPGPAWREMTRMATALTQLTLLKLFWTGDPAWDFRHEIMGEEFFYDEETYYDEFGIEDAAAGALTEDITFLFEGLPALVHLELGTYTDGRGDEELSRHIECHPIATAAAPAAAAAAGDSSLPAAMAALHLGDASSSSNAHGSMQAAAPSPASSQAGPAAQQRLASLRILNVLDFDGAANMLTPGLTRLQLSLADGRSLDPDESFDLMFGLPALKHQLAHLHLGTGMIAEDLWDDMPASIFEPIAELSMLSSLRLSADAGPPGAMSAMFIGGPGSLPHLKMLSCHFNEGFKQEPESDFVEDLMDLKAMAAACPNLEKLDLSRQHGAIFDQDVADTPAAACHALCSLTALTSLALRSDNGWVDCMFDDFASMAQLRQLIIFKHSTRTPAVTWPRLAKLSALTNLQELHASPLIRVTPEHPWKYPDGWAAGAGEVAGAPAGPSEGGAVDSGWSPERAALHQVLADVAGSEQLQMHAAELSKAFKRPRNRRGRDLDS